MNPVEETEQEVSDVDADEEEEESSEEESAE